MKHIAIITSGLVGITNACVELANRLISEGQKVTLLSPIDIKIKEKAVQNGFDYVQLPEINFSVSIKNHFIPDSKKKNPIQTYLYYLSNSNKILNKGIKALKLDEYETILKEVNPDLALVDMEIHEAILTSVKLNIKTKLISQFLFNQKQTNLPSLTTDIQPKKGFRGSWLGIEMSWLKIKLHAIARAIAHEIHLRDNRKSILIHFRNSNNLKSIQFTRRNFPSDLIITQMDTLYLVYQELEFPFKKPLNTHYLGAMVNDKRNDSIVSNEFKKLVTRKNDEGKKLIYCSITTMKKIGDLNFIKKLTIAVKNRKDWILVVSLGRGLNKEQYFENLPENVYVFSWVPQLYLLKNSDCSINHGGIHTINECLYFGVPMLIYSGKLYDQDGNLARLTYHNLSLGGNKDIDDAKIIEQKIDALLMNKSIIKNLEHMKSVIDKYKKAPITPFLSN